ncbi:hypothetical protein BT96DRAFT_946828 [Gymnopus androsaceus JB14]|uniref:Uncharacterized protein n=1 Tax=Gymnopus androsaceus JB14 TaxID=1447944 RepID=A0A6A4GVP5_9AGAR|nr:hypothetical protein BT96DRAFT_946828 [Gymnopus androsaceus JB14]
MSIVTAGSEDNPDNVSIINGKITCPFCNETVSAGTAGLANFYKRHKPSQKCIQARSKKKGKKQLLMFDMLKKKPLPIPSTVSAPSLNGAGNVMYTFVGDPATCNPDEDGWEVLDPLLNQVAAWGSTLKEVEERIRRGGRIGIEGLTRFVIFFVQKRGIDVILMEHKLEMILKAIEALDKASMGTAVAEEPISTPESALANDFIRSTNTVMVQEPVSVLKSPVAAAMFGSNLVRVSTCANPNMRDLIQTEPSIQISSFGLLSGFNAIKLQPQLLKSAPLDVIDVDNLDLPAPQCTGFVVIFPPGKTPHSAYPTALHDLHSLPWGYRITRGSTFIFSNGCKEPNLLPHSVSCKDCKSVKEHPVLKGILERLKTGVSETMPFTYHGHEGMVALARQKTGQIDEFRLRAQNTSQKLAVRERFERVDSLIQAGLKARMGIHGLLNSYEHAAEGLYHPKGYEEKDNLRAILFWCLGGARTCKIAHKSLSLPEHVAKTCIKFENENNLKMMMDDIQTGDVHLASKATVGTVGILSGDSRIYSARPILISGTCKKERAHAHADLIQCTIDSVCRKSADMNLPLHLVSLASDGEAKRGQALVELTFKRLLSSDSPLYPLLSPLKFMNLYVGDDNLTADKDWKHVTIKRLRNLILRDRGIMIDGFLITPSVARAHLSAAGHSSVHLQSVFEPEDKQDVTLAYSLLSAIWSLSKIPKKSTPAFIQGRASLQIFGKLCYHLIYPYICVDLSLTEQLNHLSAAAHLALALHVHNNLGRKFLPNQLYIDIMIMVKNAYFCVDRNLDLLQAAECLTGTSEVSNILALGPDWDQSPRCSKLPLVHQDMTWVEDQVDHIKPRAWQGDLCVANVSLLSSWKTGHCMIEQEVPLTLQVLAKLDVCEGCDILQPKGALLIHAPLDADGIADLDDSLNLDSVPYQIDSVAQGQTTPGLQAFEDMVAEAAMPPEKVEHTVSINGSILSKSCALAFKHLGSASSADCLKHVQEESRYEMKHATIIDDTPLSTFVMINEPIVTLLRCEKMLFLCVGELNGIRWNGKSVDQISVDRLSEQLMQVSFQLLSLLPAPSEDDRTLKNDWCTGASLLYTFKVPGALVVPVNPKLSMAIPAHPAYLFESSELLALTLLLLEKVTQLDLKGVPSISRTNDFPYL